MSNSTSRLTTPSIAIYNSLRGRTIENILQKEITQSREIPMQLSTVRVSCDIYGMFLCTCKPVWHVHVTQSNDMTAYIYVCQDMAALRGSGLMFTAVKHALPVNVLKDGHHHFILVLWCLPESRMKILSIGYKFAATCANVNFVADQHTCTSWETDSFIGSWGMEGNNLQYCCLLNNPKLFQHTATLYARRDHAACMQKFQFFREIIKL